MIDLDKIIGQNLRMLRDRHKYTQDRVADYLKIDRVMISYYENGSRPVPIPILMKLADLFDVELRDLAELSPVQSKLNAVFAFRATNISDSDLEAITKFKRIAKSYIKVKEELKKLNEND
jgi:transcriptional regulator with XRE-family HTH domain